MTGLSGGIPANFLNQPTGEAKMTAEEVFKRYVAEKIHLTSSESITYPEMIGDSRLITTRSASIANMLVFNLDTYVVGMPEERIDIDEQWPDGWFQAFKERWFPHFLRRFWPIKYKSISIHTAIYGKICPHIRG